MKKTKLLMLVIVMLLNNLQSLVLANDNVIPSTGDLIQTDTAVAVIPIYLIKQANAKMIERLYLLEINKQQDSIIQLKDKYINEQQLIIDNFQNKIIKANDLNNNIKNELDKEKTKTKIFGGIAGASILAIIISLFIN